MAEPTYTVKALDQSTRAAFAALVEHNNGIFGGCWRMGFHPADSQTDAAHNRAAKEQRVREGLGGGDRRGVPRGRRVGARRVPLQRRLVNLREARVHPDRKIGKHRWVVARVVEPRT